jgi:hypothetical protein
MQFTDHNREYRMVRASNVKREGMSLELVAVSEGKVVAEVFYPDATGEFSISIFEQQLPLTVIERFIAAARVALLPDIKLHGI